MSRNVGRCCRFSTYVELESSMSLLAVTKVDGLPPAPSVERNYTEKIVFSPGNLRPRGCKPNAPMLLDCLLYELCSSPTAQVTCVNRQHLSG
eukprot:6836697-Pyramimonas_sp.AAC.1